MNDGNLIRLISDFNIGSLAGFMANQGGLSEFEVEVTPFGQVFQSLGDQSKSWLDIIWTSPERTLGSFHQALHLEYVSHASVLEEVDRVADFIINASGGRYIFFMAWELPMTHRSYGMLDWRQDLGLSNLLAKCNLRLAEKLEPFNNIFIIPTSELSKFSAAVESKKRWYAAKVPYPNEMFERLSSQIEQYVIALKGQSRRLIILDLDNTLWGGVVGENGWQGVRLGGHDHLGEAYKDFQLSLKALSNRGIQLAIASKNDETVALDAVDNHPDMVLTRDDFAGWKINWLDKAKNISDLLYELNLGLGSAVFIDDNPAERSRVRQALPSVFVPEWPKDPCNYVAALNKLNCFEVATISDEDRNRKNMYVAERARREIKNAVSDTADWLESLDTNVTVALVNDENIQRVAQLFNKTNQLNLSTRRLSDQEITDWFRHPHRKMMAISVSDRFGDMGLVGIIGIEAVGDHGNLVDFILSCRVMGRKVEETLIHLAAEELANLGAKLMSISYIPTERNRPTYEVLENANLKKVGDYTFEVDLNEGFPKPSSVRLNVITK